MPPRSVSTVAWPVERLAMAEYRLRLHRVRGVRDSDEGLISSDLLARFGAGSVAGEKGNPTRDESLAAFRRVHVQALEELATFTPDRWDEPQDRRALAASPAGDAAHQTTRAAATSTRIAPAMVNIPLSENPGLFRRGETL